MNIHASPAKISLAIAILTAAPEAPGVSGDLDQTFLNGLSGTNGSVGMIARQNDGKVLIGGNFTAVNGLPRRGIVRLHPDGSLDTTFQNGMAGADGAISSVVIEQDGHLLVGGGFSTVNGMARNGIARLNSDGSVDASMSGNYGSRAVSALAIIPDGTILVGGLFELGMGRLQSSGVVAQFWNPGFGMGVTNGGPSTRGAVNSIVIDADGKALIGGAFTAINTIMKRSVASPGARVVKMLILSNDEDESPFEINLSGSLATGSEAWRQDHFGTPYHTGGGADLSDPDGDGIVNSLEYATGNDPKALTLPIGQLVKNGSTLEFTYPRRKAALSELNFGREFSETLGRRGPVKMKGRRAVRQPRRLLPGAQRRCADSRSPKWDRAPF